MLQLLLGRSEEPWQGWDCKLPGFQGARAGLVLCWWLRNYCWPEAFCRATSWLLRAGARSWAVPQPITQELMHHYH